MTTYLICYDLTKPEQDYAALEKAIQKYGAYCHLQKSVWLIVSEAGAAAVRDNLRQYLDENDKIFVAETSAPAAWSNNHGNDFTTWLQKFL